jgi:hypothetical protein
MNKKMRRQHTFLYMGNLRMMFGASTHASFSGSFTRDYFQHLCQKDDFF